MSTCPNEFIMNVPFGINRSSIESLDHHLMQGLTIDSNKIQSTPNRRHRLFDPESTPGDWSLCLSNHSAMYIQPFYGQKGVIIPLACDDNLLFRWSGKDRESIKGVLINPNPQCRMVLSGYSINTLDGFSLKQRQRGQHYDWWSESIAFELEDPSSTVLTYFVPKNPCSSPFTDKTC